MEDIASFINIFFQLLVLKLKRKKKLRLYLVHLTHSRFQLILFDNYREKEFGASSL